MKRLVSWTLRAAPPKPPSEHDGYNIDKFRNPANAIVDSADCPRGDDASMVPLADE